LVRLFALLISLVISLASWAQPLNTCAELVAKRQFVSLRSIKQAASLVRTLAEQNANGMKIKRATKDYVDLLALRLSDEGYQVKAIYKPEQEFDAKIQQHWTLQIISAPQQKGGDWIVQWAAKRGWKVFVDPLHIEDIGYSWVVSQFIVLSPAGWQSKVNGVRWVLFHEVRHMIASLRRTLGISSPYFGEFVSEGEQVSVSSVKGYRTYFSFEELWNYQKGVDLLLAAIRANPSLELKTQLGIEARALKNFSEKTIYLIDRISLSLQDPKFINDENLLSIERDSDLPQALLVKVAVDRNQNGVKTYANFEFYNLKDENREEPIASLSKRLIRLRILCEGHLSSVEQALRSFP
jgi:hypothetical protein